MRPRGVTGPSPARDLVLGVDGGTRSLRTRESSLGVKNAGVEPPGLQEIRVSATLRDATLVEDDDVVSPGKRGQSMGEEEDGRPTGEVRVSQERVA